MSMSFEQRWRWIRELFESAPATSERQLILDLAGSMQRWGGPYQPQGAMPSDDQLLLILQHNSIEVVDIGIKAFVDTIPAFDCRSQYVTDIRSELKSKGRSRIAYHIKKFVHILQYEDLLHLTLLGLNDDSVVVRREAAHSCHTTGNQLLLKKLKVMRKSETDELAKKWAEEAYDFLSKGYFLDDHSNSDTIYVARSGPSNGWNRSFTPVPRKAFKKLGAKQVLKELEDQDWYQIPPTWQRNNQLN